MKGLLPLLCFPLMTVAVPRSNATEGITSAGELARTCADERSAEFRACVGYVSGWSEILALTPIHANGAIIHFTFAADVTRSQVIHVFVKYIRNHPEQENIPAATVLLSSTSEANLSVKTVEPETCGKK